MYAGVCDYNNLNDKACHTTITRENIDEKLTKVEGEVSITCSEFILDCTFVLTPVVSSRILQRQPL